MKNRQYITSDVGSLVKVIIHPIGDERKHLTPRFGFVYKLGFSSNILGTQAKSQHDGFVKSLTKHNIKILNSYNLVDNALRNLHHQGKLKSWLSENFPEVSSFLKKDELPNIGDLIGASDRSFFKFDSYNIHTPELIS